MEGAPKPDDSIPELVARLIDDGEEFIRSQIKLYRARLFARLDNVRTAIALFVIALSLIHGVIVAALVGLIVLLREHAVGVVWATLIVVAGGIALAAILAWIGMRLLKRATEIRDAEKKARENEKAMRRAEP